MSDSNATNLGLSFPKMLTVLFIGLKLGHVINWSWWWVLSPLWISVVLAVALADATKARSGKADVNR